MKIIYEDEDIMVVDKPAGVVTTRENQGANPSATASRLHLPLTREVRHVYLEDWVNDYFPNDLPRKGIVHRLDKGTSGLVVVAKNDEALAKLKEMFKKREVKKTYLALVSGDFPFEAEIQMPIKRSNYGFEKFSVSEEGKAAWTIAKVVGKYQKNSRIYSKLAINLKTGRTHQIRVHLSYLRYPIVGDRLYGGEMILDRPYLHATKIEFIHPLNKNNLSIEVTEPDELINFLGEYEKMV